MPEEAAVMEREAPGLEQPEASDMPMPDSDPAKTAEQQVADSLMDLVSDEVSGDDLKEAVSLRQQLESIDLPAARAAIEREIERVEKRKPGKIAQLKAFKKVIEEINAHLDGFNLVVKMSK